MDRNNQPRSHRSPPNYFAQLSTFSTLGIHFSHNSLPPWTISGLTARCSPFGPRYTIGCVSAALSAVQGLAAAVRKSDGAGAGVAADRAGREEEGSRSAWAIAAPPARPWGRGSASGEERVAEAGLTVLERGAEGRP